VRVASDTAVLSSMAATDHGAYRHSIAATLSISVNKATIDA